MEDTKKKFSGLLKQAEDELDHQKLRAKNLEKDKRELKVRVDKLNRVIKRNDLHHGTALLTIISKLREAANFSSCQPNENIEFEYSKHRDESDETR